MQPSSLQLSNATDDLFWQRMSVPQVACITRHNVAAKECWCFAALLQFIVCTAVCHWGIGNWATTGRLATAWGRLHHAWREGITLHTSISLQEFILQCIASCTLRCPFPPLSRPCSAGNRRSTDSSDSYHVDGAVCCSIVRKTWKSIASVSRPKKISPDNDTTQYMQISPSSQYPNTGIVRTLFKTIFFPKPNGKREI